MFMPSPRRTEAIRWAKNSTLIYCANQLTLPVCLCEVSKAADPPKFDSNCLSTPHNNKSINHHRDRDQLLIDS
ncbi:unnamed protein product [Lasius platythorax]|uniref:Uncharacterized protein n=1 Tax=Lasius platythorax TaxID=488582 RepID=A0AAV2NX69_9HYME